MSNQTQSSLLLVAAISGGIGFVAFLILMVVGTMIGTWILVPGGLRAGAGMLDGRRRIRQTLSLPRDRRKLRRYKRVLS